MTQKELLTKFELRGSFNCTLVIRQNHAISLTPVTCKILGGEGGYINCGISTNGNNKVTPKDKNNKTLNKQKVVVEYKWNV